MLPKHLFVRVGDVIICYSDGLNLRGESLKRSQVTSPRIASTELVVQNGPWRMNVRLPAPPFRSAIDHCPPPVVSERARRLMQFHCIPTLIRLMTGSPPEFASRKEF